MSRRVDHPRIRGEHRNPVRFSIRSDGSSPHTRGAHAVGARDLPDAGIIPAYAGSTVRTPSAMSRRVDHPRIRGEHSLPAPADPRSRGSSPHTRGARTNPLARFKRGRIIPAYAGSTPFTASPPRTVRDHPRIRGEHAMRRCETGRTRGSSPHTRGAQARQERRRLRRRIIPAYAGSTIIPRMSFWCGRDHPRIRGEHFSSRGYGP